MNKLTPFEDHLYQTVYGSPPAFLEDNAMYNGITEQRIEIIKSIASIALQWIEKAFCEAYKYPSYQAWLRENNLSYQEGGIIASNGTVSPGEHGKKSFITPTNTQEPLW